jgi:MFS family permease
MTPNEASSRLPTQVRVRIFIYLGCLITLLSLTDPNGGLMDVPMSFILKNQLRMSAEDVATFRLSVSVPLYFSFLFGLFRDAISARRIRDREIIGIFSLVSAALYFVLSAMPITYWTLVLAALLPTASFLFVSSAQSGLAASLAQQHSMSGQISAVWNIFSFLPATVAFVIGGHLSQFLETETPERTAHILFLVGAAFSIALFVFAFLQPRSVFENVAAERNSDEQPNLHRLAQLVPVIPALAIWSLWNFSPGAITPLQYFLQDSLGATDVQWGTWNALFTLSFVPAFVLYGFLSSRISFRALLWWSTPFAIPQFVPLLFIKTLNQGLVCAVPIGLFGGMATAAYLDLIIRSCPRGLQGTMVMMSGGLYFVATRFGDIIGTHLYAHFDSFKPCVFLMTSTYALIPVLLLAIPKKILEGDQ